MSTRCTSASRRCSTAPTPSSPCRAESGTLEELVEQLTWAQLNRHMKPILIADIGGFWRPLLALFAHMRIEGFIREGFDLRYMVAERIEDVLPMLRAAARRSAEREPQDAVSPRNL